MTTEHTEYGVVTDPKSREFVRWVQYEDEAMPFFSVRDCFQYIGIKRLDIPKGPSIKARVRGAEMCRFWRDNYAHSGTEAYLGIQANDVRFLTDVLRPEQALSVAGGIERLCYFLLRNGPLLLMDTTFVSPQKFDSLRYRERFARSPRSPHRCDLCMQPLPSRPSRHSSQHR